MYPGHTTGIDQRVAMDKLMEEFGSWVLVRHYDLTTRSQYWNAEQHEATGGPPWEWTDYVVRSREVPIRSGGVLSALEMPAPMGLITVPYYTFYLKWNAVDGQSVTEHDEIFKVQWSLPRKPEPSELLDLCTAKYNILAAYDILGDSGRMEYYLCVCKGDKVGW